MGEGASVIVCRDFKMDESVCAGVQVVQGIFDELAASDSSLPLLQEALDAFDVPVVETYRYQQCDVLVDLYVMYYNLYQRRVLGRVNESERNLMTRIETAISSWGDRGIHSEN